ncbi:MAG: DUF2059 domain-containing protein [Xanthobacteraceae bacterium]|nr:DUF2059 domain-containing protein [Xanthobacteraceae bacterium]
MNKFSKALLLAGIGLALSGVSLQAQSPKAPVTPAPSASAVAAATELMNLRKTYTVYQNLIPNVIQRAMQGLVQNNLNYQKDLEEISVKLATELGPRREEIGKAMAQIYASKFSEDELKGLLAFYKSPLGQKFLETEPKAIQASFDYINEWGAAFSNEVANRFRAEMKARGKPI